MNMRGMTIDGMLLNTMQSQRQSGDRKKKEVDDERNWLQLVNDWDETMFLCLLFSDSFISFCATRFFGIWLKSILGCCKRVVVIDKLKSSLNNLNATFEYNNILLISFVCSNGIHGKFIKFTRGIYTFLQMSAYCIVRKIVNSKSEHS